MVVRNITNDIDMSDSSSDSGLAESVNEEDSMQQVDENSLAGKGGEAETESEESAQGSDGNNQPEIETVAIDGDDFKFEWVDTFEIPLFCLANPLPNPLLIEGPIHTWKGVDWSTMLRLNRLEVGAYVGYNDQPYELENHPLKVRYMFYILREGSDDVALEGSGTEHSFGGFPHTSRNDNGFCNMFPHASFVAHLREVLSAEHNIGASSVPLRLKVVLEVPYLSMPIPLHYNSKASTGLVGLENLGATCYLNALLQMLYHVNSFRCAVYKLPHEDENLSTSTTLALQTVFRNLQTSDHEVTTKELTVAFGWTSAEAFLQQDVQEMMRVLIDKLEDKMKGTVVDGMTKQLFAGRVRSYIKCVNVQYESKREEDFYDIQLDVKGCRNIYHSFDKYIEVEMLDGENQYEAGEHGKQDAQKGVIFETFPPVLTVHLKRFDFDLQTMNFTKIHDHYEFPLRLELDRYVAESSLEESPRVPNNYVLHSVLVHQGDVGGGHYYAYIRPTTDTFQYSTLADPESLAGVAHKDRQWFKFNDETVSQVPQREAVDICYGRRFRDPNHLRGLSSAYMLVYIRETEAPEIMKPVTMEDIPRGLEERLQMELDAKRAIAKRLQRRNNMTCAAFATETEVAQFTHYSRNNDWLDAKLMKDLFVLKESSTLCVLLNIADRLHCNPVQIRLWEIERDRVSFQLGDDLTWDELHHRIKLTSFYAESVPFCGSEEEFRDFEATYQLIRSRESHYLDLLRAELLSHEDLFYSEDEDPVAGCGIGSSNLPIAELRQYSEEVFEKFNAYFLELKNVMLEHLKDFYQNCDTDQSLVFIKLYDPYDMLPQLGADGDASLNSASEDEHDDGEQEEEDGPSDEEARGGSGGTGKRRRTLGNHVPVAQYMPMKYLGSVIVAVGDPVSSLALEIQNIIQEKYPSIPAGWQEECQKFGYSCGNGPTSIRSLPMKDISNNLTFAEVIKAEFAPLFYVDIIPSQPRQLLVPFNITDTKEWMLFQAYKKSINVRPFQERDVAILKRRARERVLAQARRDEDGHSMVRGLSSPITGSLQSPGSLSAAGTPQRKRPKFLPRDRSSSMGSQRDRAGSTGSELATRSPARTPLPANRRSLQGKSFPLLFHLLARVVDVIKQIADEIDVDPAHLALFFVHVQPNNSSWPEKRFDTLPTSFLTCGHLTVKDILEAQKVTLRMSANYCVFYRINAYGPVEGKEQKTCDFLIVDERIRYWRRLFLEHLRDNEGSSSRPTEAVDQTDIHGQVAVLASAANPSTPTRAPEPAHIGGEMAQSEDNGTSAQKRNGKRSRSGSEIPGYHPSPTGVQSRGLASEQPAGSLRAASIVWPGPLEEYDARDELSVTYRVPYEEVMWNITEPLRNLMGIPRNIAELEALKQPVREEASGETCTLPPGLQHLQNADVCRGLSVGPIGTCSDMLTIADNGRIQPAFPLLITCIRDNYINEFLNASAQAERFVSSMSELSTIPCQLFQTGVQYVSPEDALFLSGTHPTVRSMPLTVFSYELSDRVAYPLALDDNGFCPAYLPFVSYLREDDDWATLARRLAAITGEKDSWQSLVLALIPWGKYPQPVYLPRSNANAGLTPTTSPQLMGRKESIRSQDVDSQATEVDPELAEGGDGASVVAAGAAAGGGAGGGGGGGGSQLLSMFSQAIGAAHRALGGPALTVPSSKVNVGTPLPATPAPSGALWKLFRTKFNFNLQELQHSVPARGGGIPLNLPCLGIQRRVYNTVPKIGSKKSSGAIKII